VSNIPNFRIAARLDRFLACASNQEILARAGKGQDFGTHQAHGIPIPDHSQQSLRPGGPKRTEGRQHFHVQAVSRRTRAAVVGKSDYGLAIRSISAAGVWPPMVEKSPGLSGLRSIRAERRPPWKTLGSAKIVPGGPPPQPPGVTPTG
jgi:hypothetical protein